MNTTVPQLPIDIFKKYLLQNDQVKLLYSGLPLSLISNFLLGTLMLGVMWPVLDVQVARIWLGLLGVVLVWRGMFIWKFKDESIKNHPWIWLKSFRLGIFINGFLWGNASLLLFPSHDLTYQVFMAFVLAGISAGAITSLAADRISAISYVMLALLPLALNFLLVGGQLPLAMGLMVLLYVIFLMVAASRLQNNLYENVALRADAFAQHDALCESESRFRFMLETCPTAVNIAKLGGHDVMFFNKRYTELINASAEQLTGLDVQNYYANPADYADILLSLNKGEQIFERLIELNIPGAGKKWALATYLKFQYEGLPAMLGWFHDITERILVERMKSEFVSTVSHELRTPLTAISGGLRLVTSGMLGELTPQAKEMLDIATKNSLRLTTLINDLLDLEELSEGKLTLDMQEYALQPLFAQAFEINSAYGMERRVSLILLDEVPDIRLFVDKHRMMQVFSNLFSNAIKYSDENGKVEVAARVRDNLLWLTIKDYGPGIPAEFHDRIFKRFTQADSSDTRKRGGTGLGLAITRDLVQQMHGQIGFESVEGEGASFYIKFPLYGQTSANVTDT